VTTATFTVLCICTGNICRSPLVERLFAAGLQDRLGAAAGDVVVRSAGTWGLEGSEMEPFAATALRALGGDDGGFRARELAAEMVSEADLVLCATRDHRAAAVGMVPRAAARTFTVREFDRLCSMVDDADLPAGPLPERAAALVRAAASRRGLVPPEYPGDDDLPDPIGAPASVFSTSAQRIATALRRPMNLLAGPPSSPGRGSEGPSAGGSN
jgi:protein-tyrosine phosphatase